MKRFELIEGETASIPAAEINADWALELHRRFPTELEINFPSPLNDQCYQLRSRGYVGVMPCGPVAALEINPKIRCALLMPMLECAYKLPAISAEVVPESMGEIYELWAEYLAVQVLSRIRRGLFWNYDDREGSGRWVRGRMLIGRGEPVAYPSCRYAEHTPDIIENRILASALYGLRRFAFKREQVQGIVGKAWWALSELDHRGIEPGDCLGLQYHRLNQHYKAMHALCYALLKQRSPVWGQGEKEGTVPAYAVHMPTLFEQFCIAYLTQKLKDKVRLASQYHSRLKGSTGLSFRMDLALFDSGGERPLAIIDAKYKVGGAPVESDIQQVVAYAVQLGVRRAFLLYPDTDYDQRFEVGPVRVQTLGFDLGASDLDRAGREVITKIENAL